MPISLTIATPCPAEWSQMDGDDRSRFCHACSKSVYNVEAMTEAQVRELIQIERPCLRLFQRFDGTVLTADCAVGLRMKLARAHRNVYRIAAAVAVVLITGVAAMANIGRQRFDGDAAAVRVVSLLFDTMRPPVWVLGNRL